MKIKIWQFIVVLMGLGLLLPVSAYSQSIPHEVPVGFKGDYWVDSVSAGSLFVWKIDSLIVQSNASAHFSRQWNQPGNYILSVQETSADGCLGEPRSCLVTVKEIEATSIITAMNAFTPNGDNLNDVFKPLLKGDEMPPLYRLEIYNNWGELLYESNNIQQGWDGNFKGKKCPPGTYVFVVSYHSNGIIKRTVGNLSLIR